MKIVVDHIKDAPLAIHFDESISEFPLLADLQSDHNCAITGNITGDITVSREFDNIRVVGRISAPLALSCSRCIVDFESFVDTSFTIFFRKESVLSVSVEDELELGEMDLLSSVYSGDEIDLTHEIEEQVVMEIPLKPLCSDLCKGLCHKCGTDLNISTCSCSVESVNISFSALKDFKVTKK